MAFSPLCLGKRWASKYLFKSANYKSANSRAHSAFRTSANSLIEQVRKSQVRKFFRIDPRSTNPPISQVCQFSNRKSRKFLIINLKSANLQMSWVCQCSNRKSAKILFINRKSANLQISANRMLKRALLGEKICAYYWLKVIFDGENSG